MLNKKFLQTWSLIIALAIEVTIGSTKTQAQASGHGVGLECNESTDCGAQKIDGIWECFSDMKGLWEGEGHCKQIPGAPHFCLCRK